MLQAKDLAIARAERMVIEGANIAIRPGAITAICGPNGAGKSSLLAGLAGLLRPVRGELSIDGKSLDGIALRVRARTLGFLPQDAEAAWDVDVKTLVGLGRMPWRAVPGRPARAAAQEDRGAVGEAMSAMELGALADRPLSTLSGGERARAMMARVLAGKPRYILADEPFASLDIGHARDLARLLREQARQGRGLAVVMHDLALAMNIADTVIVLDAGRIVADAPPEQALSAETIARVWRADVRWLGQAGARALSI
ncbi:ABC transporter ATP-binding protein [Croceicoccus mobilis]|uniref:ABC transporter n=1 Tax=Croceicoccus mobilis TaxID=1703339 RepID=A0A916YWV6_9SPHN|nr:ABC transporter ATP-binding protein [Croceicoccus mobilis]GGD64772.1 ABC transporter [Croceicoccus mobilis]